jgi:glycosyltransferase involved in cell wall biosynthesis
MKTVIHTISAMDVFGPEKTVLNECLALEAAGWRARIVNLWESEDVPMSHKARSAGARYEVLRTAGKFDIAAIRTLARQLRAEQDVVVHSHGYKADLYTLLAARMAGVPVMTSAHGWTSENAKVRLYERLQAYLWRWFDRVVAVSQSYRELAEAAGVPERKLVVVHNAIRSNYQVPDAGQRRRSRELLGLADGDVAIAVIGRLGVEKGHRLFVEAAGRLAPRHGQAQFLIIGDGAERAALESQIAEAGLGATVRLLGHRNDLPAIYPGLDMLAITSLREGLPNVLLEAMLHGVPAVAMAVGGVPEVISDGEDGLLVAPGSLDGFIAALSQLLSDASQRQRLGAAAVEKVRSMFLFDARMQKMLVLYEAALAKPTSTTPARWHA